MPGRRRAVGRRDRDRLRPGSPAASRRVFVTSNSTVVSAPGGERPVRLARRVGGEAGRQRRAAPSPLCGGVDQLWTSTGTVIVSPDADRLARPASARAAARAARCPRARRRTRPTCPSAGSGPRRAGRRGRRRRCSPSVAAGAVAARRSCSSVLTAAPAAGVTVNVTSSRRGRRPRRPAWPGVTSSPPARPASPCPGRASPRPSSGAA